TSLNKQYRMLSLILAYQEKGQKTLERGAEFSKVIALKVRERIGRAKYIPEDELAQFDKIEAELSDQMSQLTEGEL
ncbi:MAG: V-type ATP synthase subunit A, partial [Clostridia bacterium]